MKRKTQHLFNFCFTWYDLLLLSTCTVDRGSIPTSRIITKVLSLGAGSDYRVTRSRAEGLTLKIKKSANQNDFELNQQVTSQRKKADNCNTSIKIYYNVVSLITSFSALVKWVQLIVNYLTPVRGRFMKVYQLELIERFNLNPFY